MKKLLYFALICSILVVFASCKKDEEPKLGSLFGVVTDYATGDPIRSAGVELLPKGMKSVTGDDGVFSFTDIEEGVYKLYITKTGYKDYTSNDITVKATGDNISHSIQLEKLPPSLTILDDAGNEVTTLDFGDNPEVVMMSFYIFNQGEDKLEWNIVYSCAWISSVSKTSGELKPNGSQPLVVKIDRNKLNIGDNSTTIHVVSNSGTRQIIVSASSNNVIETLEATDVRANSVVLNGNITRDMEPSIKEYGFVYGTNPAPIITNGAEKTFISGSPIIGTPYNKLVSKLQKETMYYARAYVSNGVDTIYGSQISFLTVEGLPVVKTLGSKNVTSASAIILCEATDDAGATITARGVCYSLTPLPTIEGVHSSDGSGIGKWESSLSELTSNATYYIRAYATNAFGTGYGEQITISTKEGLAVVHTGQVSAVTANSASCTGEVVSDGDRQVTERGICWRKSAYPSVSDAHVTNGTGTGTFKCSMTELEAGTEYHVRAYAINSAGTVYGEDVKFTTSSLVPTVTTQNVSGITSSSALVSGTITSTGGATITEAGFKYKAEGDYSYSKVTTPVSKTSFSYQLDNLEPDTKYYVQAYAVNESGRGEGAIVTFTTSSGLPQISTVSSSQVGSVSAIVTGKIISDGGFPITECGICYSSTNKKPTLSDKVVKATATTGQYSCELTDLEPATKYYARAYAINASGTAYDYSSIDFKTTNGTPAISIAQQPTYSGNNATLYGKITSNGGVNIKEYGVVLGLTNQTPSIDNYDAIISDTGNPISNDITFNVINIPSGKMIYYRFFVINELNKVAYSSSGYIMTY